MGAILQLKSPMPLFSSHSSASKRLRWWVPLVFLGGFIAFAKVMNTNPPTNTAQTSPQDPELRTRLYKVTPAEAAKNISAFSISTYGRSWTAVEQKLISANEIHVVFHVPVVVFTDVLTVTVKRRDGGMSEVNVESHSQVGQGDFGENRRHIVQMLAALDQKFA